MARIFTSGFESNSYTAGVEWTSNLATNPTFSTGTKRSGSYAMRISSLTSASTQGVRFQYLASEATNERYFRFYAYFTTFPGAENRIAVWNDSTTATSTPSIYLTIDNSGVLKLYDEDGQITGTSTLQTGTWYCIEVHYSNTGGAGACVVEARVNYAAAFASSTTRSIASNNSPYHFFLGGNLGGESNTTGDWYFDDVAINDTSGSFQTSWPGEGEVIHLRPSSAGDNSDWSGSYVDVSEVTPDDATTMCTSNTLNQTDDHNIDNTPSSLESSDIINCVHVGFRYDGASSSANAGLVIRIKSEASGTVQESTEVVPANTTWYTYGTTGTNIGPLLTLYDLPGASTTAWTKDKLDTTQIGYRTSTGNTNAARVSTIWLIVDHKPAPTATDNQPAFIQGKSTTTDSQLAYIKGVTPATDQQPAFILGKSTSTDQQPSYIKGKDTNTDSQPSYIFGQGVSTDNQIAFIQGKDSVADQQSSYVRGESTSTDAQPSYIIGADTATDNQIAFVQGKDTSTDQQPAYIEGYTTAVALVPISDISQSGLWVNETSGSSPLYDRLDEQPSADDDDYVTHVNASGTEYFEVGLTAANGTPSTGDIVIHFRGKDNNDAGATITIELRQGGTVIATKEQVLTESNADYTYTLTAGERASITNWNDLRFRVTVQNG